MGTETQHFELQFSWKWIIESISTIGPAFLVGCAICSVFFGLVGYFGLNWLWRFSVQKSWNKRKAAREDRAAR